MPVSRVSQETGSQIEAGCLRGRMALITLAISWGYDLTSHTRDYAQTSADLQLLLLILEQKAFRQGKGYRGSTSSF